MTPEVQRIAGGVLVALVGGFFIAVALNVSPARAVVVWLLTVVCCGIVIDGSEDSFWHVFKGAVFPALVLSVTPVLYFYFLAVIAFIENPYTVKFEIPWGHTAEVRIPPLHPLVIAGVVVLWVLCFFGSLAIVSAAGVGSRLIISGAEKLYAFGPEGITRAKLIVLALGAVLAAFISFISVLSN